MLEIQPPSDLAPLDRALRALDSYDWLILTSANAVRAIAWSNFLDKSSNLKVAAVGEATATAARKSGLPVALVPETYSRKPWFDCLADQSAGKKILLARAEVARDVIPDALRAAGATVDVVDAYRNVMPPATPERLRAALEIQAQRHLTVRSSFSWSPLLDSRCPDFLRAIQRLRHGSDQINRQWKDNGRVVLGSDLHQGLQVTQLDRRRLLLDDCGGHRQFLRGQVFTLGMDDFRATLAFGFGLAGDGADHLLGQLHLLHLDQGDLHAP